LKRTFFPTDFSDATGMSSLTGKFRSSRICNILVPTRPVAPTTATFIGFVLMYLNVYKSKSLPDPGRLHYLGIQNNQAASPLQGIFMLCFVLV
jgi:hypothetical protein